MVKQGDLQLLPETRKKIEVKVPGENKLLTTGVIILAISVAVISVLYIYVQRLTDQITEVNGRILKLESERDKNFEKEILTFNRQAGMINKFLDEHVFWSHALEKIENLIQPQVQLKSLNALSDSKITMTAVTSNYAALAKQIASFGSGEAITDVYLRNIQTKPDNKLEFSLELKFDKNKFLQ